MLGKAVFQLGLGCAPALLTSHSAAFRIVFPMRQSIIFMIALAMLLVFIRFLRGDAVVIAVMDAVPVQLVRCAVRERSRNQIMVMVCRNLMSLSFARVGAF